MWSCETASFQICIFVCLSVGSFAIERTQRLDRAKKWTNFPSVVICSPLDCLCLKSTAPSLWWGWMALKLTLEIFAGALCSSLYRLMGFLLLRGSSCREAAELERTVNTDTVVWFGPHPSRTEVVTKQRRMEVLYRWISKLCFKII